MILEDSVLISVHNLHNTTCMPLSETCGLYDLQCLGTKSAVRGQKKEGDLRRADSRVLSKKTVSHSLSQSRALKGRGLSNKALCSSSKGLSVTPMLGTTPLSCCIPLSHAIAAKTLHVVTLMLQNLTDRKILWCNEHETSAGAGHIIYDKGLPINTWFDPSIWQDLWI